MGIVFNERSGRVMSNVPLAVMMEKGEGCVTGNRWESQAPREERLCERVL